MKGKLPSCVYVFNDYYINSDEHTAYYFRINLREVVLKRNN